MKNYLIAFTFAGLALLSLPGCVHHRERVHVTRSETTETNTTAPDGTVAPGSSAHSSTIREHQEETRTTR